MKRLVIDLATLPEEGKDLQGELEPEVFGLPDNDARPVGPLEFELRAQRFGSELLLSGRLFAAFELTCVRSVHPFIQTIVADPAAVSLEIGNDPQIDATETLREELLLQLPANPRCEDGDEPGRCEIDPRYLAVDKPVADEVETPPRDAGDSRWGALDHLGNLER